MQKLINIFYLFILSFQIFKSYPKAYACYSNQKSTTSFSSTSSFKSSTETSSIAKSIIMWQSNDWAYGCDFKNKDLSQFKTDSKDCGGTCYLNNECTHFTWTQHNGGTCWLKHGNISKDDAFKTNDNMMICGVVRNYRVDFLPIIVWNKDDWATECEFKNNDLMNIKTNSENCGPTCFNNPQCTHYTWTKYDGGTCWLKYGNISKINAFKTEDKNMICGISRYSPLNSNITIKWDKDNWAYGCDFINHDFKTIITKAENCGLTCQYTPNCTHFTWKSSNNGTCILKYGPISKNDAFKVVDITMICGIIIKK